MMALTSVTRRQTMLAALGVVVGNRAWATSGTETAIENVNVEGVQVRVTRYTAPESGKRPTVLLLHGSKGLDAQISAYDRYARDLAKLNIDTLLFTYFQPDELATINEARTASVRKAQYARSVDRWVSLVRDIAIAAKDDDRSSGHVGLLGFSLGGLVAVAAASQPLFSVVTVFYAGIPSFYDHKITFLPPLLDIHGDVDQSVPLSQGSKLIATAKHLGGVADLAVFRNQGHGFDLDLTNPDATPARLRATAFISRYINQR